MDDTDWIRALGGGRRTKLPLAARKRKVQRTQAPPRVGHVEIRYRQWDGPRLPWSEDFGKASGQVYALDGGEPHRSCNEVEVAKLLRTVRKEAYWVCSYAPEKVPDLWKPWSISPYRLPDWLTGWDREVRRSMGTKIGGIPDVAAWDPDRPLETLVFVECKGPKEDIKEGQEDWAVAAFANGLPEENFAVALRTFV